MSNNQANENTIMNYEYKKDKLYFSNAFSKFTKSEKNKEYQNLQSNLNSLSRDVRLLIDFVNKDKFSKNKGKKGTQYRKLIAKGNFLLRKKQNGNNSSILNIINNYIKSQADKKKVTSEKKSRNKKPTKRIDKSKDHYSIYKTEVNKSSNLSRNELPKINFNFDKSLETNIDSNINNINTNDSSSVLPNIQNKETKKNYLLTENDEIKKNKHKIVNRFHNQFPLPKQKTDLNNNLFIKKFPNIINKNQRLKSSINRNELSRNTEKMLKIMNEKNKKIKNGINYTTAEQSLIDWEMKSKIKLASWKYGIAEIEKYFVDLKAYGKQEEEELIKRKTFYDIVEDLIDDIKRTKGEKDLGKGYGKEEKINLNDLDNEEINNEQNNDINLFENAMNKHSEVSKDLEKIKIRRLNEERTRHIINNILVQSDLSRKAINRSTDKLNAIKEEMFNDAENSKTNKTNKKGENKFESENVILIKTEKEILDD